MKPILASIDMWTLVPTDRRLATSLWHFESESRYVAAHRGPVANLHKVGTQCDVIWHASVVLTSCCYLVKITYLAAGHSDPPPSLRVVVMSGQYVSWVFADDISFVSMDSFIICRFDLLITATPAPPELHTLPPGFGYIL